MEKTGHQKKRGEGERKTHLDKDHEIGGRGH